MFLTIQGSWFASYRASYVGRFRWGNCFLESLSLNKVLSNSLAFICSILRKSQSHRINFFSSLEEYTASKLLCAGFNCNVLHVLGFYVLIKRSVVYSPY